MNRALYAALLCLALVTVQRRSIADGRQLGAGGSSSVKCPGAALVSVQDGLSSTVVEEPCQDETVSTTDSLDDMIRMGVKDDSSSGAKNVKGGHVLQSAQTTPNKNISAAVGQIGTGRPAQSPAGKAAAAKRKPEGGDANTVPWDREAAPAMSQDWSKRWLQAHRSLAAEVQAMDKSEKGLDVLFLGDSAIESLRGTYLGSSWTAFATVARSFKELLPGYSTRALGIAGDTSSMLLWRLKDGEFPRTHPPRVVVLMSGSADLSGKHCVEDTSAATADRLIQVVKYINEVAPETYVLVVGVLPKGERWPNICTKPIEKTNALVKEYVASNPKARFLDAGAEMVDVQQQSIIERLIPDAVNPSEQAWFLIARFYIQPLLDDILAAPSTA